MNNKVRRVAIVAGELSGDVLAGQLIVALRTLWPNAIFEGVAGLNMEQQGCQALFSIDRLSVMGLVEVLRHLPELLRIRRELLDQWRRNPPDVFIGVDAPDFNLPVAHRLRQQGIPTVHFISPSVWAWRKYRVRKIARAVDLMLVLLPFEEDFYKRNGVNALFVGHPFADVTAPCDNPRLYRERLALPLEKRVIGLLPGSRVGEVARLAKPFFEIAAWCAERDSSLVYAVPCATPAARSIIERELAPYPNLTIHLFDGQAREIMAASDVLLVASGTATLEALLVTTPMVVAYRLHPLTYALASRLLHVPYFSLPNLLANTRLVDEFTQEHVCAPEIGPRLAALLNDADRREKMRQHFRELGQSLRHDAARTAAAAIVKYAGRHGDIRAVDC